MQNFGITGYFFGAGLAALLIGGCDSGAAA